MKKVENKEIVKNTNSLKNRSNEIFSVFVKHGFYINGFTPLELRTTLEDLGPTYVKIGQIMSSRTDFLPIAYCKELEKLRSNVKPLDSSIVRSVIEKETGKKIEDIYSEFNDNPLGSASIAQAHYGVLKDGTKVVTKVQRPFIGDMMRKDFVILRKLASAVTIASEVDENGNTLVDFQAVITELEKVTEEELDFRVEAENTKLFRELCIEDDNIVSCPTIIDDLTTEKILTMTFVDGYSISKEDKMEKDNLDRDEIGRRLITSYMHQVFDAGIFHADPHQGNIMVSNGVPYWIDFGMIGHISEKNINIIQQIIFALIEKDIEELINVCLSVGITKGKVNKAKLMDDVEVLMDKYLSVKTLTDLDIGQILKDLTDVMAMHNISMPSEFTMLMRSLITIEGVLEKLCPNLNIFDFLTKKMIERAKENFDLREKLTSAIQNVAINTIKTVKLPSLAFGILKNLAKGRLKINFELAGYDDLVNKVRLIVKDIILCVFSSVLFIGSCTLAQLNIEPTINGFPFVALIGFVVSISLAIYTIMRLIKKNNK